MYQALYRKYRPLTFSDVVGQEHITTTLSSSLSAGKVFHAYLFTGTRGTGKTTCAKILAKAVCCENPVNGEPCGECSACKSVAEGNVTDISEIDAASNNSVNDIRDLKEQVNFLPVSLKYRVYIIDEVHMLSTSAFNALLKTLEEPPAHVIFILATTEVHKLPATILSRCQRFDFKRLEPQDICGRMNDIAAKEGFSLTLGAGVMIASLADGGMRDALSILDQCSACSSEITEDVIADVCGIAGNKTIIELANAIKDKDTSKAVEIVDKLYRNSVDMKKLIFELISCFRNLMIIKTVKESKGLIICSDEEWTSLSNLAEGFSLADIINNLSFLQSTGDALNTSAARSEVELTVVRLCNPEYQSSVAGLTKRIENLENALQNIGSARAKEPSGIPTPNTKPEVKPLEKPVEKINQTVEDEIPLPTAPDEAPAPVEEVKVKAEPTDNGDESVPVTQWPEILAIVKKNCPLMGGVLVGSRAFIGGGRLLIDSKLSQFKEMINSEPSYRNHIRSAAEQVLGVSYNLGPYKPKTAAKTDEVDPLVQFANSLKNN